MFGATVALFLLHWQGSQSQEVDSSMIPDIVAFPYTVYLVTCQFQGNTSSAYNAEDFSRYSCYVMCRAELSEAYTVTASSVCAAQLGEPLSLFSFPSTPVGTFEVKSSTTDADSAIRYALTGGNYLFVCKCTGAVCSTGVNLVVMGQVNPSISYSLASASHSCRTCSAKVPIGEILNVGQSGGVTLYNGFSSLSVDASVPPGASTAVLFARSNGTIVKFISYDREPFQEWSGTLEALNGFNVAKPPSIFQAAMNKACRQVSGTSVTLTGVPFSPPQYLGKAQCADPVNGASQTPCVQDPYLPFTGSGNNQAMMFAEAGTVAVCTCGVLTASLECQSPYYWTFASLLSVSGPIGNQTWSIPTGTVFGLNITGWGLGLKFSNRDFVRIVPSTVSCTDNANNPSGISSVLIGCPDCTSLAGERSNIPARALRSADDVGLPKITRIKMYASYTKLTFSSPITNFISSGDRIVVSLNNITVNGLLRSQWSNLDAFRAYSFAGRSRFADRWAASDCPSDGSVDCDDYLTGNVVTVLSSSTVSIPAGLDEFQSVFFSVASPQGADWELHSRLFVGPELKAVTASSGNKVCWGRKASSAPSSKVLYFGSAGVISFYQPASMSVSLIPSSLISSLVQPMTLTFVPDFTKNPLLVQLAINSTVVLKISLLNIALLDWVQVSDLEPSTLSSPSPLDPSRSGLVDASICGFVFTEFALNHQDGFPQPSACMYTRGYSDQGTVRRDIYVYFAPSAPDGWVGIRGICRNGGKRSTCNYQLGFQGIFPSSSVGVASSLVRVDITCPFCLDPTDPYLSIMAGTAVSRISPVAPPVDTISDTVFSIFPSSSNNTILKNSVMEIAGNNNSSLSFGIARNGLGILPSSFLRLTFQPVLQINISSLSCSCLQSDGSSLACTVENPNTVRIKLSDVSAVSSHITHHGDVAFDSLFTLSFPAGSGINPPGGFAPTRMLAQLSTAVSNTSVYAFTSSVALLYANEVISASTARLVTSGFTGDGNLPFTGQTGEVVQMQIRPGRTVNGFVQVTLPRGYWCDNFGWIPFNDANNCRIVFPPGLLMNAGSWNFFNLTVFNPHVILMRTDPNNVWTLSLGGAGPGRTVPLITSTTTFIPAGIAGSAFSGNRAVLGQLVYAAIQANSLTLSIFIQISSPLPKGSGITVIVDPPSIPAFFVDNSVEVISYPETYQGSNAVSLVPSDLLWQSSSSNSSLVVNCSRNFQTNSIIAFTVKIMTAAMPAPRSSWIIFTTDSSGNAIEGSLVPVSLNSAIEPTPSLAANAGGFLQSNSINTLSLANISAEGKTVQVTLPDGFSIVSTSNGTIVSRTVMVIPVLSNNSNVSFQVLTPTVPSLLSVYACFLEIVGFSVGSVLSLPPIAAVTFLSVRYSDSTIGAAQTVVFTFTTASTLVPGDFITIFQETASLTLDLSRNASLNGMPVSVTPMIGGAFTVGGFNLSIPASRISVNIPVINPSVVSPGEIFSVSTSKDPGAQKVQSSPINENLPWAELLGNLSPDKRPGMPNSVTFNISSVPQTQSLLIEGPPGFVFENNCSVTGIDFLYNCTGSKISDPAISSRVIIFLTEGTLPLSQVFTISCINPPKNFQTISNPALNVWTITVFSDDKNLTSHPIPSFTLSDFVRFQVDRTSNASFNGNSYPMRFSFIPRNPVPSGGRLRVIAPPGYVFDIGSLAEVRDLEAGLAIPNTSFQQSNLILTCTFNGNGIQTNVSYALSVNVFPPPIEDPRGPFPYFKLTSFTASSPLDESTVEDVPVLLPSILSSSISISNVNQVYDSAALVNMSVTASELNSPVEIRAPMGFLFILPGGADPQSTVTVNSLSSVTFFTVKNPVEMSANPTLNFFVFTTIDPVSTAAVSAWRVVPQFLSPPTLVISGPSQSAGSVSALTFSFTPSLEASFVFVNISSPKGFDFTEATSASLNPAYTQNCASCFGLGSLQMKPHQSVSFTLEDVVLGYPGGPINFVLTTVYGSFSQQTDWRESSQSSSLFMPGRITVLNSTLKNHHNTSRFAEMSLNPTVSTLSDARIFFRITLPPAALPSASQRLDQPVFIGLAFSVNISEYRFLNGIGNFSIHPYIGQIHQMETSGDGSTLTVVYRSLIAYWLGASNATFTAAISEMVIPQAAVSCLRAAWKIDMLANETLFNTNDGISQFPSASFSVPVSALNQSDVNVSVRDPSVLRAPLTLVPIEVSVSAKPGNKISISCPPGVSFVSASPPTNLREINSTQLNVSSASEFYSLNATILAANNPSTASIPWLVVAFQSSTSSGETQIAWGTIPGISVYPMPNVAVIYAGMSGVSETLLVIEFTARKSDLIHSLEIYPPFAVILSCSNISIPFFKCSQGSSLVDGLTLNLASLSLPSGTYSLPMLASLPLLTPAINTFDIVARDSQGNNCDGIFGFPGRPIIDSETLSVSQTSVTLSSIATVSFYNQQDTSAVDAITVSFPQGYFHQITSSNQAVCFNRRFPRESQASWVDFSSSNAITFLVDNTKTTILSKVTGFQIPLNLIPGNQQYIFQFPIVLPAASTNNPSDFWVISFCPDRTQLSSCVLKNSTAALAQFPVLGRTLSVA